jgi:hypothetical protein
MSSNPSNGESQALAALPPELRRKLNQLPDDWTRQFLTRRVLKGQAIREWMVKPIDYNYRPKSYWEPDDLPQLFANIKGAERKEQAFRLLREGRLDQARDIFLTDTLTEPDREKWGLLHPANMGGEYLPDYLPGEVEIARLTLDSVTKDVFSIRARLGSKEQPILYRVLDEYETEYKVHPDFSQEPLTLRELIGLIDTTQSEIGGIGLDMLDYKLRNGEEPAAAYAGFLAYSSEFYPALKTHFWFAIQRWMQDNKYPQPSKWQLEQFRKLQAAADYPKIVEAAAEDYEAALRNRWAADGRHELFAISSASHQYPDLRQAQATRLSEAKAQADQAQKDLTALAERIPIYSRPGIWTEAYRVPAANYRSQGFGADKCSWCAADFYLEEFRRQDYPNRVRQEGEGSAAVWIAEVELEPAGLEIVRCRPGQLPLREWVRLCWKHGCQPRVFYPWLPADFEAENGLDYFGGETSQLQQQPAKAAGLVQAK